LKRSTRNIARMHGWRIDRTLHNYLYFTFYNRYVVLFLKMGYLVAGALRRLRLPGIPFRMVFERYHSKVVTLEDAAKILTLNEDVVLGPDPTERIIPYRYANKIILKEPDFIAVMDCPCRLSRDDPCEPVDVCMAVGRTTAEFWLEHGGKFNARRITQEEALARLRESHERGDITTAWFKVATGGRTGVICSCCSCCCGALEGMRIAGALKGGAEITNFAPSGYAVEHDVSRCVSCARCVEVCIFGAAGPGADGVPVQDNAQCMGCGLCVERCGAGARTLSADGSKGLPLDIEFVRDELLAKGE